MHAVWLLTAVVVGWAVGGLQGALRHHSMRRHVVSALRADVELTLTITLQFFDMASVTYLLFG